MIPIKTPQEIAIMREGGHILASIMKRLIKATREGISTAKLNDLAEKLIWMRGAEPSFKGYQNKKMEKPFPGALCVSVNEEVVHSPGREDQILREGDIVSLDLGLKYKGYYVDMARTVPVGKVKREVEHLIKVTHKALVRGLKEVRPNNRISDISGAIQKYVEGHGFSVVRDLVGHGIGKKVHEEPGIPNWWSFEQGSKDRGPILKPGIVLCLEPMVTAGSWEVKKAPDGWGVVTADGSLSAHFEETVAVTEKGCEVLTK